MVYLSKGPKETEKLAGLLSKKFLTRRGKKTPVIALEGELGAGKTTFVKGVAKALDIQAKIKSPTFNLIKIYKIRTTYHLLHTTRYLYHLDCYRLRDHRDLKILGIKEILNNPSNIVLIEWADRVKKILPKKHIKIHIDHIDKNTRKIVIKNIYSPPSLKLRKGTSSLLCEVAIATQHERSNEEMPALQSSEGAKK